MAREPIIVLQEASETQVCNCADMEKMKGIREIGLELTIIGCIR